MATAPNPIIISAERGLLSLADKDVPVINVTTPDEFEEAYQLVLTSKDYETICIDSISEVAEVMLSKYQGKYADGRKAYGELNIESMKLMRKFRDIFGKHVFMIAKELRITDDYTGITSFVPSLPGKTLVRENPYLFDEVFSMQIGETNKDGVTESYRFLQTQPSITHLAKDRSGKLNPIERPNLTMIVNKIMGKSAPKTQKKEVN
jgi:hypothetical protein